MEKDPSVYVRHILEAIANIEMDTAGFDFEKFRVDRRARQLVERNLEILSEASRRLPEELKEGEAQIPWRAIAGIGNVLRHDYHETYSSHCCKRYQEIQEYHRRSSFPETRLTCRWGTGLGMRRGRSRGFGHEPTSAYHNGP
jgi:uncharacterized protein with HEPN domain